MKKRIEFRVLQGNASSVQQKLNQWRHLYDIEIHGMSATADGDVTVILTRISKETNNGLKEMDR